MGEHLEKLEEHRKPRGSKLVAATQYKVLTQGDMELPECIERADKLQMHVDGQRTPKTWLSGMQLYLDSKIQWCIKSGWKRTKQQNFGKRTFCFTGAKLFNKLPLNIVRSENVQTFCRRARHFFLS